MSVVDTILVSDGPGERRVAMLADGLLVEYAFDRADTADVIAPGAILRARVIDRSAAGTLVELGAGPPALMAEEGLSPGEAVVVQVLKSANADKGPRVTRAAWLDGPLVSVGLGEDGVGVAKPVGGPALRGRLRVLLNDGLPEGFQVRVEAAAEPAALIAARDTLIARWRAILAIPGPGLLAPAPGPAEAAVAAHPGAAVLVDHPGLKAISPRARVEDAGLFDRHEIDHQLAEALSPRVPLPGGGDVVIERTAALVAIDVNGGGRPPADAASASIPVIARHLRLRRLSGLVLVDLPREPRKQARDALARRLAEGLGEGAEVLGHTRGGLLELRVARRQAPLEEALAGPGTTARAALRALLRIAPTRPPVLRLAPAEAAAARALQEETQRRLGLAISIIDDPTLPKDRWSLA